MKADPDPVLHAPGAPEPEAPALEAPAGKSEAPASVAAAAGADEPVDAEVQNTVVAPTAETATSEAPKAEEPETTRAWSPSEPEDDGEAPAPLPGMPDMTPVGAAIAAATAAKLAGDAPLTLKGSPTRDPAPADKAPAAEAPLFIPRQAGQGGKTKKAKAQAAGGWADHYLTFALLFALAPAVMAGAGIVAIRLDLITQQQGFDAMLIQGPTESLGWAPAIALVGVLTGLIGLLVAIFNGFARLWPKAVLALAVTALTWGAFIGFGIWDTSRPLIHDVATDWSEPLMFSPAVLKARGPDANPVDPSPILPLGSRAYAGRTVAEVNAETCPAARPVTLATPAAQAFANVRAAIEGAGMSIITADAASGRIEATAVSLLYGFKDDLIVRVRPAGAGSRIDLRAVRRTGASDMGANCRRIENLATAIAG